MEPLELLYTRRSMRRYEETPVSEEDLNKILKAAMLAPTALNGQTWHFVVIRDKETRKKLIEYHPYMTFAEYADTVILVCGDTKAPTARFTFTDCAAATQNILLAAHALGLGACWCAVHPYPERQDPIGKLCGLPEHIKVFSAVTVGHPGKELPPVPDRFDPEKIHREKW